MCCRAISRDRRVSVRWGHLTALRPNEKREEFGAIRIHLHLGETCSKKGLRAAFHLPCGRPGVAMHRGILYY